MAKPIAFCAFTWSAQCEVIVDHAPQCGEGSIHDQKARFAFINCRHSATVEVGRPDLSTAMRRSRGVEQ
jgi:hypothetical protein